MKFWDKIRLILHEYRYEKLEWMISVGLQWLIFTSVLFLFTVAFSVDEICGEYMKTIYPEGYDFFLTGYGEQDISKLEEMGFCDISFSSVGDSGYARRDDLDGIWRHKLQAAFSGKDIWNEGLDEILCAMLFCQITFFAIGVVMLMVMLNNLSNSFTMKLMRRKHYIRMLRQLGCSRRVCQEIYYIFFALRNVLALILATGMNAFLVTMLNRYMAETMYIYASFDRVSWLMVLTLGGISMFVMWISFRRQWRQMDESER